MSTKELTETRAHRVAEGKPVSEIDHRLEMLSIPKESLEHLRDVRAEVNKPNRLIKEELSRRRSNEAIRFIEKELGEWVTEEPLL